MPSPGFVAPAPRGRSWLVPGIVTIAVLVVAALVATAVYVTVNKKHVSAEVIPPRPGGDRTTQAPVSRVPDTSGIPGVLAWDTGDYPGDAHTNTQVESTHVLGPVTYAVTPPMGGPHYGTPLNAGIYVKPVPSELAVHDLEHGAVWITYRPGLRSREVARLVSLVARQSLIEERPEASGMVDQANRYITMSPWVDNRLPAPIVISAWGHQLRVDSARDDRLQKFIDTFRHSETYTPHEEFEAAVDGRRIVFGGRPDSYGGRQPNPS